MSVKSTKAVAIELRKKGYSYSHIAKITGLSKGTLSYHLSKIPFVPNKETIASIGKARTASILSKAKAKRKTFDVATKKARNDLGQITQRDIFMLGLGIYIGEGSKTNDIIRLANTDHRVINRYMDWLMHFGLHRENFVIRLHIYPDTDISVAEEFWMGKTGLFKEQFYPASIDRRRGKDKKRKGAHRYGTAHVTVRSNGNKAYGVELARRIGACMEGMLEYPTFNMRA